jgi:DNA modification methylase
MKIETIKTAELVPYDKNPRINDNAVDLVANSIREFGFKQPIVIDKNKVIIAGHTRWKAAKQLGLDEVPCVLADDLTPAQVKAYRLADNKVAEASEWDYDLLEEELDGILDIDMSDFGFDTEEEDTAEAVEDEYEPDIPEEPVSKRGQVYQLGEHRLMIGDSTNAEDVAQLCDGEIMDLVVTDPPYNVAIENSQGMTIENDDMDSDNFYDFLVQAFENMNDHLKAGGVFYIWHASRTQRSFEDALNAVGLEVREQLIWNKNALVLGRQDYQWKHEPCFYGWKDGASHYFINTRTLTTVIDDDEIDLDAMKKDELKDLLQKILEAYPEVTVINEKKPAKNDLHPTMKPIKLIARQVKNSSRTKERVLDLFGGSGSTLIACEQLDRKCYMMEYDPRYADVIIDRWESQTGKKAVLLNG